jgi:hypothetical protein
LVITNTATLQISLGIGVVFFAQDRGRWSDNIILRVTGDTNGFICYTIVKRIGRIRLKFIDAVFKEIFFQGRGFIAIQIRDTGDTISIGLCIA